MGRPHKYRKLTTDLDLKSLSFIPEGIPDENLTKIYLTASEIESLNLRHFKHLKQVESAEKMGISQTTFSRIVNKAYEKITRALLEGKAICIQQVIGTPKLKETNPNLTKFNSKKKQVQDPLAKHQKSKNIAVSAGEHVQVIFNGFGCNECGFQWEESATEKTSLHRNQCPECKGKAHRLIKKGPTA